MNKSYILIAVTILLIASIGIFFILKTPFLSPTNLEKCNVLTHNGDEKTNIVFFSPEDQAKEYSEYLLTVKPFSENQKAFNFYYIDSYVPECELYQGIALLCYSKELIKKASSCPNDYMIVLKKDSTQIRSSSYMNLLSLNSKHPLSVLTHEFGHAFSNLADEYVPSTIPRKSKNCVTDCEQFGGEGCYKGCSKDTHYRSTENSVMRNLYSENYGDFNEKIISSKLNQNSPLTGKAVIDIQNCEEQTYYLIELTSTGEIIDKEIETGCPSKLDGGDFTFKILKQDGTVLSESKFNANLLFTDNEDGGGIEEITGNFFLPISTEENPETLEISKEGTILSEINLKDIGARPCKNE